eukprot:jgi/Ulvmu1/10848/UM007_0022.1
MAHAQPARCKPGTDIMMHQEPVSLFSADTVEVALIVVRHSVQPQCRGLGRSGCAGLQVPALKFAIMIAGFTPRDPQLARLFSGPLSLPSVHIIGERDMMKRASAQLMTNFDIHTAIWHKQGHVVPRLSEEQLGPLRDFLLQFSARKSRL